MKLFKFYCCFLFLCVETILVAQDKPAATFSLSLNHDSSFGLYPIVNGSIGLNKNLSLTFYGVFWTNPTYGNSLAPVTGSDLWLESGIGISRTTADNRWLFNPSLGFTHGKLLSGGERGVVFDGIAPNIALFHFGDKWEGELYSCYYKSLRKEGITTDYFLGWLYAGYKPWPEWSFGLHVEDFSILRADNAQATNLYRWVGAYVKFILKETYLFRFSAGKNMTKQDYYSPEYYRLGVTIPFLH